MFINFHKGVSMGYTNYWDYPEVDADVWNKIIDDVAEILPVTKVKLTGPSGYDDPALADTFIGFNGDASVELDHESFMLSISGIDFDFCKTARKPYDLAVQCTLIVLKNHCSDAEIRSDGTSEEWQDARDLCQKTLGYGQDFTLGKE